MIDLIGAIAATLTTISFLPQVWQIWRTRSARDVSLPMYLTFTTGVALWLAYGILVMSWPIIIANIVTMLLALCVITMKLKWG
jgi:MtN3 and saliva related transmembrane protein